MATLVSRRRPYIGVGIAAGAVLLLLYTLVYWLEPFSDFWNSFWLDGLTALAAILAASMFSASLWFYQAGEPPRRVWASLAVGVWLWALAELIWMVIDLREGGVAGFTSADIAWLAGYVFLSLALLHQFEILFGRSPRYRMGLAALWLLALLGAYLATTLSGRPESAQEFVNSYANYAYPFMDLVVGIQALVIVIAFRQGTLALPWLTFFIFVISDSLYVWATESGLYFNTGDYIRLLIDDIYIFAYVLLMLGALKQYLLLRFGTGEVDWAAQT